MHAAAIPQHWQFPLKRLRPGRAFTHMGELCHEVGWKHWALIKQLEAKRKEHSAVFYAKKKAALKA